MTGNTVTQVEQRVNELSRALSADANEFDEARKNHDDASARWEDAQLQLSVAKEDLAAYLAGLEENQKVYS